MTFHYSSPFESLIDPGTPCEALASARVVIVGSGYGGSIAALRLANPAAQASSVRIHDVMVLERGKEYALGDFPTDLSELPGHLSLRTAANTDDSANQDALFDLRLGENVDVLVGSGLGGTSLINANVAIEPEPKVFTTAAWPKYFRTAEGQESLRQAFVATRRWLDVPRPGDVDELQTLPKYRALGKLAQSLQLTIEPAPINVALQARTNHAGVQQAGCTHCGNCVSGCNVGAKSTLMMNLIPAAAARGVEYFTGATVYSVQPIPAMAERAAHWRVYVKPTSKLTRARFPTRYYIEADKIVLAAGALGSTEILSRSQQLGYLKCATSLGRHFSTNGDGVAASFGEKDPVQAMGARNYLHPPAPIGPTITACVRPAAGKPPFLLEDGAIPAPLVELFGEIITTAAQFGRLGYNKLPAWLKGGADPLAVHPAGLQHGQVFLLMGDDGARGTLQFKGDTATHGAEAGSIVPMWSSNDSRKAKTRRQRNTPSNNPSLKQVTELLATEDRRAGLNDGQFVANPLWQLLPESASSVMEGVFPNDRLLTVHPLGGCRMADSGRQGVVNHDGQVFIGDSEQVYPGLSVLDGAILPSALGANPFLTIAALAWRACDGPVPQAADVPVKKKPLAAPKHAPAMVLPATADIVIREQLIGALPADLPAEIKEQLRQRFATSPLWFERDRLVLRLESEAASTQCALRGGGAVEVRAELYLSPIDGDAARRWKSYGISSERLGNDLIASGTGTMTVLEPNLPPGAVKERRRAALRAYSERRASSRWQRCYLRLLSYAPLIGERTPPRGNSWFCQKLRAAMGFLSIAEMHATYRTFDYQLSMLSTAPTGLRKITMTGSKVLAWTDAREQQRLWGALTQLDANFTFGSLHLPAPARLYVDMDYLLDDGLLSVAPDSSNVMHALFNCFAYASRMLRAAVQTSFWEFGAPQYPKRPLRRQLDLPRTLENHKVRTIRLEVPGGPGKPLTLLLHRYGTDGGGVPVLLIHGLAQGSLIYAHERLQPGMARYFLTQQHQMQQHYDVWLLDLRLSTQLGSEVSDDWAIDEMGEHDVPLAVRQVLEHYPQGTKLHVFAHCVGAVAISMAILKGKLDRTQLASVALNAIHPWVMPSPSNQVRAKLGCAFRNYVDDAQLDPIIQSASKVTPAQSVMDRLAYSMARAQPAEAGAHAPTDSDLAGAICDRMTLLYGRMWKHANVRAIHGSWADLVGKAPAAVYRHLYYLLTRGRIVDRDGGDVYIDRGGLDHWRGIRTLFLHGEDSEVFNPQSATRSAIRLHQALGVGTPIKLRRIPGFGHMDPILADDAAEQCFRYLHHFFEGRCDDNDVYQVPAGPTLRFDRIDSEDDPEVNTLAKLHCGPVLRAARIEQDKYVLRYWLELPTGQVEESPPESFLPEGFTECRRAAQPHTVPEHFAWIDAVYPPQKLPVVAPSWPKRLASLAAGRLLDCHFIVASCRYPGTPFDVERSDDAYEGIKLLLNSGEPCDALFLIGDQIYADATAGLFDALTWRDRYEERYWRAFNSKHARDVLSCVPTHFALDDHEIANDFAGVESVPVSVPVEAHTEQRRFAGLGNGSIDACQLEFAKLAAAQYMGTARANGAPQRFWYALDHAAELNCPAFIMDTRSERERSSTARFARLCSPEQIRALTDWLMQVRTVDRPKLIFSGSVIAPLLREAHQPGMWMREDGLAGYPKELDEIITCIVEHQIQHVVFIGGDLHLSCIAEMKLTAPRTHHAPVRALQIVASGLYAPLTFANTSAAGVDWKGCSSLELPRCTLKYTPQLLGAGDARFVKVAIRPHGGDWEIEVTGYDPAGKVSGQYAYRPIHTDACADA